MESLFLVQDVGQQDRRTFYQEEKLPSLPVPCLKDTLKKYLDSCKAVLDDTEYRRTEEIVNLFEQNEGKKLHELLLKRAQEKKNWLEDWWLDGYLDYRGPLSALNFAGSSTIDFWPSEENSQDKRVSMMTHCTVKFWSYLRDERLRQLQDRKGDFYSMQQFRVIFNTCRVPCKTRDRLVSYFKTKYEGTCPNHIIVIYRQRLYKVHVESKETGEIYNPGQFREIFMQIKRNREQGAGVCALSELDRESAANARNHLAELSSQNAKNIKDIESAIMCVVLYGENVKDDSALMKAGAIGLCGNRWTEKLNHATTLNGRFAVSMDHTPADGMAFVTMMAINEMTIERDWDNGTWKDEWSKETLPTDPFTELEFVLDENLHDMIAQAKSTTKYLYDNSDYLLFDFEKFGKIELKNLKVHPCAFTEVCIQLAYMRKHGKPATTYETAATRRFYHGRTETLRVCTPELIDFCNTMINDSPNKKDLFWRACEKYHWLMDECCAGRGCDRHLLGLSEIAKEIGMKLPDIFTDPAYTKTGGNANFILSTSLSGYESSMGSTIPMREDGYGVYFRIRDHTMHFAVTTFNPGPDMSTRSMEEYLRHALTDVYKMLSDIPAKL